MSSISKRQEENFGSVTLADDKAAIPRLICNPDMLTCSGLDKNCYPEQQAWSQRESDARSVLRASGSLYKSENK